MANIQRSREGVNEMAIQFCRRDAPALLARAKNETAQSSNVRAANMGALPDDPGHFWRWLSNRTEGPICPDRYCFAPRLTYEDYLASLIAPTTSGKSTLPRLTVVHGQCVYLSEDPTSVTVTLADGPRLLPVAVLATGNEGPIAALPCDADPWAPAFVCRRQGRELIC